MKAFEYVWVELGIYFISLIDVSWKTEIFTENLSNLGWGEVTPGILFKNESHEACCLITGARTQQFTQPWLVRKRWQG